MKKSGQYFCKVSGVRHASPFPPALSGFASGLLDRQAESMRALTGFLKVVAACLEGTRFEGPLRWSLNCS